MVGEVGLEPTISCSQSTCVADYATPRTDPHGTRDMKGRRSSPTAALPPVSAEVVQLTLMTTNGFDSGWRCRLPIEIRPTGNFLPFIEPEKRRRWAQSVRKFRPSV